MKREVIIFEPLKTGIQRIADDEISDRRTDMHLYFIARPLLSQASNRE